MLLTSLVKDFQGYNKIAVLWPRSPTDAKTLDEIRGPAIMVYMALKKKTSIPYQESTNKHKEVLLMENERIVVCALFFNKKNNFVDFCRKRYIIECIRMPCTERNREKNLERLKIIVTTNSESLRPLQEASEKIERDMDLFESSLQKLERTLQLVSDHVSDWKFSTCLFHKYASALSFCEDSGVMAMTWDTLNVVKTEISHIQSQTSIIQENYIEKNCMRDILIRLKFNYEQTFKRVVKSEMNEEDMGKFRNLLNNELKTASTLFRSINASHGLVKDTSNHVSIGERMLDMENSSEERDAALFDFLTFCIKQESRWSNLIKFCRNTSPQTTFEPSESYSRAERILFDDSVRLHEMPDPLHWKPRVDVVNLNQKLSEVWDRNDFPSLCARRRDAWNKFLGSTASEYYASKNVEPIEALDSAIKHILKIVCSGSDYLYLSRNRNKFMRKIQEAETLKNSMSSKMDSCQTAWLDTLSSFKSAYTIKYNTLSDYRRFHIPVYISEYLRSLECSFGDVQELSSHCHHHIQQMRDELIISKHDVVSVLKRFQQVFLRARNVDPSFAKFNFHRVSFL